MAKVLEVKNVTKTYPGVVALDNVSFDVEYGEILALIGENGAGKSTVIKTIAGAINPDSGTIVIDSTLAMNGAEGVDIAEGVNVVTFKATEMAEEAGLKGLANIICLGKLWAETHFCTRETLDAALTKCVPATKQHLLEPNRKALQMGIDL